MAGFDHVAVEASDLDGVIEFYEDAFGFERANEFVGADGARNVFVRGEDGRGIQFKEPTGEESAGGVDHFGLTVDDLDERLAHLEREWGVGADRGPIETPDGAARVAFVTDPAGYVVELVEPLG